MGALTVVGHVVGNGGTDHHDSPLRLLKAIPRTPFPTFEKGVDGGLRKRGHEGIVVLAG